MVFDCLRFHNNHFTYINYTIKSSNDTGRRICSTNCIKRNIFCSLSHIFWTSSYNLCFVWMEIMFVTSSHRHQRLPKQQTKETPTRVHIYSTITWHTHKFSQPLFTFTSTVVTESFHGSFHRPETLRRSSGSSVSDVIWLRLLRHLKPTRSRLWTPATSLTLTSSTLRPPSTHSTLTHCFFFLSYRILGKNLTKKSGVQSENISINNVPCDP